MYRNAFGVPTGCTSVESDSIVFWRAATLPLASASYRSRSAMRWSRSCPLATIGRITGPTGAKRGPFFRATVAYVWHGALHASTVSGSLESCGFEIRSQIVWAKPSLVMGRGHYHWQHEPCWYAVRGTGHWNGDRKQSTLWHIENRIQDAETTDKGSARS